MNSCHKFSKKIRPWKGTNFDTVISARKELQRLANSSKFEHPQNSKDLTPEARFVIFIFFIFVGLCALGTAITVFEYFQRPSVKRKSSSTNGNIRKKVVSSERKETLKCSSDEGDHRSFKSYLKCFCLLTNGKKLLSTASMDNEFDCLYGMRFVSILIVVLGHVCQAYCMTVRLNEDIEVILKSWVSQITGNAFFVVNSFLVLSGFLNAYSVSYDYHRYNGNISWIKFYVNRFLRITPGYMMILGFHATLFSYSGSGPLWPTYDTEPRCKETWWMHLLYINNFITIYDQCMLWTWYIAVDMQFFIISPLFIIPLIRKPKLGYTLIGVTIVSSCFLIFCLSIKYCLRVMGAEMWYFFTHPEQFVNWQAENFDLIYGKPYTRISSYLLGIALGCYFYKTRLSKKRINKATLFWGWIIAVFLLYISFFALYKREESLIEIALYNASKDFLFSCSIAWLIYVCLIGEGGFLNRFFSWRYFFPVSRLSYCVYLVHMSVTYRYHFMIEEITDFSPSSMILMFLRVMLWSHLIAFLATLLFEIPVLKLIKLLKKLGKKIRASD